MPTKQTVIIRPWILFEDDNAELEITVKVQYAYKLSTDAGYHNTTGTLAQARKEVARYYPGAEIKELGLMVDEQRILGRFYRKLHKSMEKRMKTTKDIESILQTHGETRYLLSHTKRPKKR
jgi:hypothetical protein